ncbi:hypothetical protein IGG53_002515 [Escherichia coli]|uniref:DUF6236 family protein n=1 Tax=Escherichia coli TaxID=562 RepID=UPI000BE6E470|nr:DUF6236 family protein [Escherichia coli]EFF1851613.1 hypothetical protein [Escherichia coli]EFH5151414.1 hypothetical protein [Escherichia coli]EGI4393895.1 hypothetical protein [Escherichia coli]NVE50010.1 hypothetical protein [Escherichia coli]NVF20884.1 hypothetical protein [Escherichia coli]
MKKGIITSSAKYNFDGEAIQAKAFIEPKDIRYLLMYWDKVVIPANNIFYQGVPDEEILMDQGFLERPIHSVEFSGFLDPEFLMQVFLDSQTIATKKYQASEPSTEWAIHQFSKELLLVGDDVDKKRNIRINLINALPSPPAEAPIEDVIDFKMRRQDLLIAFHKQMEDLYIEAVNCPDRSLGFSRSFNQLNEILKDLERVSHEKWGVFNRFSLSPQYSLDVAALIEISEAVYEYYTQQSIYNLSGLFAAGLTCLSIEAKLTSVAKWNKNNPILAYLTAARKEGLI